MDGTLLNSKHEVSSRFYELFYKLQEKGILFVAASGRQYHSMVEKLAPIKDEITFIAENGAFIKQGNQELDVTPLNQSLLTELLHLVDGVEDCHAMLCGKYNSFFDKSSMQFVNQIKDYYSAYEIVDSYDSIVDEIVKIAVYHPKSSETYIYPAVKHLEDKVKVKVSGQNWIDFNHIDAHKGNALAKVMKIHNIAPHELLVFGDYNNDLEMLAMADLSFAMKNAHPDVKKIANYTAESNDNFGVEKVLAGLL